MIDQQQKRTRILMDPTKSNNKDPKNLTSTHEEEEEEEDAEDLGSQCSDDVMIFQSIC